MDKKKLFVGGLPWSMSGNSLQDLFAEFGEISETVVISDRDTGRSKGFGFVTFTNEADAKKPNKKWMAKILKTEILPSILQSQERKEIIQAIRLEETTEDLTNTITYIIIRLCSFALTDNIYHRNRI